MASPMYEIRDLHFAYDEAPVLSGVDLEFKGGALYGIIGPNGSGKSTLLDLMTGTLTPNSGNVLLAGYAIADYTPAQLAVRSSLVPQEFNFNFPFTVRAAVLMGRHPHIPRFSRPSEADMAAVEDAMKQADILHLADRPLSELSGGEKQRTVLARTFAQDTPAILLDEPTSNMDIRHALSTMHELQTLAHHKGRTVIAVLHDLNLAAGFCDHIVILKDGRIHMKGPTEQAMTPETIHSAFGVHAIVTKHSQTGGLTITYNPGAPF